jgi:hypothetical protein
MKDQLAKKATKIEEIKTTLKHSQLVLMKQSSGGQTGFGLTANQEPLSHEQQELD